MKEYIVVISCALFVLGAVILGSHVGLFDAGCIELLGIGIVFIGGIGLLVRAIWLLIIDLIFESTLFTAYCPRCKFVTQHRQASTDEIITRIEYGCEA